MEKSPIQIVNETADTVTLLRADFDSLIKELEDAEDRIFVMERRLLAAARALNRIPLWKRTTTRIAKAIDRWGGY
jgi:hypothetical protein